MAGSLGQYDFDSARERTAPARERHGPLDRDVVAEVVRTVLTTMAGDLTATETTLIGEVEALGRAISAAKREIAALRVDDITDRDIPFAADELDAILQHTAAATHEILESCEMLDEVAGTVGGDATARLRESVTKIYEACSFQDITGQRITKVVTTLKMIEAKVAQIIDTFGAHGNPMTVTHTHPMAAGKELLNGPQLPPNAMDQSDIDKLLASLG